MELRCPGCGKIYGPDVPFCPDDVSSLEPVTPQADTNGPAVDAPEPASPDGGGAHWDTATCWHCGQQSPAPTNTECLNPECRRSLVPPALLIRFEFGQVEVQPGERSELGRHGEHRRTFHPYSNVSRRHAVVGVDASGEAWIDPLPTINGTFVNDVEISPGRHVLRAGDIVRLARDAKGTVKLYRR